MGQMVERLETTMATAPRNLRSVRVFSSARNGQHPCQSSVGNSVDSRSRRGQTVSPGSVLRFVRNNLVLLLFHHRNSSGLGSLQEESWRMDSRPNSWSHSHWDQRT